MFGKLTWDAIPWTHPIPLVAGIGAFGIVGAVVLVLIFKGTRRIFGASG